MAFNSIHFLVFFPIVCLMFFVLPQRYRWILLLTSSYIFYMFWRVEYVLVVIGLTLMDYWVAIKMSRLEDKKKRRPYLYLSLAGNLGLLFVFKYLNFFGMLTGEVLRHFHSSIVIRPLDILLPIGISFHIFQTLSYTIEVYRGEQKAETHLGIFALYVAFFPQLVAGPIERAKNLLPQLKKHVSFDEDRVISGMQLILWGMFKKVMIADRLALFVDHVYQAPRLHTGPELVLATIFFGFQIFCDFSGYSDIAVGAARIFGVDLMRNFNRPYLARSIPEFWHRWHISLSTWFRDYVFIPLGGSKVTSGRWYRNILVTFLLSGLWHGAGLTFVVWGMLHGFYYIFGKWTKPFRENFRRALHLSEENVGVRIMQALTVFGLVSWAWIFFRANNISDALYIVTHIFSGWHMGVRFAGVLEPSDGLTQIELIFAVSLIVFLKGVHVVQEKWSISDIFSHKPLLVRWGVYLTSVLLIVNLGITKKIPFIYFQF